MELSLTLIAFCILMVVVLRKIFKSDQPAGKNNIICSFAVFFILSVFVMFDRFIMRQPSTCAVTDIRLMTSAMALTFVSGHLTLRRAGQVAGITLAAMAAISLTFFFGDACRQWLLYAYSALALIANTFLLVCRHRHRPADIRKKAPQTAAKMKQSEEEKMSKLFERTEEYMRGEKPYLEIDFSEDDLATYLYTNKAYLSRTINRKSGKNFCRYVNSYRVAYAIELMKQNPRMKVTEVSIMSGFHTVVSFNMAFKLVTNCTPGEYQRNIQAERL